MSACDERWMPNWVTWPVTYVCGCLYIYVTLTWDQALFSFRFVNNIPAGKAAKRKKTLIQQQGVTLQVLASRWTEVCGGIGSQRTQQTKMAPVLKITVLFNSCLFYVCRVQKRQSFLCNMREGSQGQLLVFSVTSFKIDQNNNQNKQYR